MSARRAPSLATNLCGVALRNPVLAASGTFGYGVEFEKLVDLNALGGLVVKGLSREPIEGNPPPRVLETEAGMINSIGLQNIGVRAFVREKLPRTGALLDGGLRQRVRLPDGRLRGSGARAGGPRRAGGLRVERVLPQYPARRHFLFERSGAAGRGGGGGEAGGAPADDREAVAERERHRAAGAGGGGKRRGCHLAGEYFRRAGHRRAHAPPAASARGSAGFRDRPSSPSPCAWCTRRRAP